MKGIERLLAAILLVAAVAGAAVFPRFLDGSAPDGPLGLRNPSPGAPAVQAAPAPVPAHTVHPARGPGAVPAARAAPLPAAPPPAAPPPAGPNPASPVPGQPGAPPAAAAAGVPSAPDAA